MRHMTVWQPGSTDDKPRIGISACLIGEHVRYDGGHAYDAVLTEPLSRYVDWVSVCPEAEAGLGTPREPMHLHGQPASPRLLTNETRFDHTQTLTQYTEQRLNAPEIQELCGYVFKSISPSCGIERVPLIDDNAHAAAVGMGIFARAFKTKYPLIPIVDERRLHNPTSRTHFLDQAYCYYRWRRLAHGQVSRGAIAEFHTRHKYLLMAYSPDHYQRLGQLVGNSGQQAPLELAYEYGKGLMDAVKHEPTIKKHTNVLYHMMEHCTPQMEHSDRLALQDLIMNYHRGIIPLREPLQRIRRHARTLHIDDLCDQAYLNPYPDALMR